jgi:hypothetical protein
MSVIIDGSAGVTTNIGAVYNGLQTGTAQATSSGTSITFSSIPSWVKRITVMFSGVSLSGTANFLIQIGNATAETTGYVASTAYAGTSGGGSSSTAGLILINGSSSNVMSGNATITNLTSNTWTETHNINSSGSTVCVFGSGVKTTSGAVTVVKITTTNGTDTFTAGSVNIIYE